MTQQRFYLYTPPSDETVLCNAGTCEFIASWWDVSRQAFWRDFHAAAEQAMPVRVRCPGCFEWYYPSQMVEGVCVTCRSVMPMLWVEKEVNHEV